MQIRGSTVHAWWTRTNFTEVFRGVAPCPLTLSVVTPLAPRLLHSPLHLLVSDTWAKFSRLLAGLLLFLLLSLAALALSSFRRHVTNYPLINMQICDSVRVRVCACVCVKRAVRRVLVTLLKGLHFALSLDCQAKWQNSLSMLNVSITTGLDGLICFIILTPPPY